MSVLSHEQAVRFADGRTDIRADFPVLARTVDGVPLNYLDSAATSLKPQAVIDAIVRYYSEVGGNIHRGKHMLSEEASTAFETARVRVAQLLRVPGGEVVFTAGTTHGINIVALSLGLTDRDLVLIGTDSHHSNQLPWRHLARTEWIRSRPDGTVDLDHYAELLQLGPAVVALTQCSNVTGRHAPIAAMTAMAHDVGAITVVDAAQSMPHQDIHVPALGADALAFSAHKMLGPTGIGVLWARRELLEAMPPFLGGGEMIRTVTLTHSTWNELPWKFEAGTMCIAEAVGLGAAVQWLERVGMERVFAHDRELAAYAMERLGELDGVRLLGPPAEKRGGVVAFTVEGVHPHDVAMVLDRDGVCVRAGHHCAMPLHEQLGIPASVRASFHCYSLREDVDALVEGLRGVRKLFAR